jgi:hypothetical protein
MQLPRLFIKALMQIDTIWTIKTMPFLLTSDLKTTCPYDHSQCFRSTLCGSCEARMLPYTEIAYRMFTLSLGDNLSDLVKLAGAVGVLASSHISFAQNE